MGTAVAQQAAPASLFGLPGVTRAIETKETNDGSVQTLAQATTSQHQGLIPFRQTDVILGWEIEFTIAQTIAAGTGTVTASQYFPFNYLGNVRLNLQNQFDLFNVENGIDAFLFQLIRPQRQTDFRDVLYETPRTLYSAQANLVSSSAYTTASTSIKLRLEIPGGLWFDFFYPLDAEGRVLGPPMRAFVSPQYMSGTARVVTPVINYAAAFGTVNDTSPYTFTGNATATALTSTINPKRRGYYQPQSTADSPPLYNWQYTRKTTRVAINGVSTKDILIPLNGQILMVYVRLFDPAANGALGAAIPVANVKECDLLYGSGLFRFQDVPTDTQARFLAQHGVLLTEGVLVWDMAVDEFGRVTNAYCLNTMNTSGCTIHLDFTGTQSASAYCVVGVEALTYVEVG